MLPLPNLIIITGFSLLGIGMIVAFIRIALKGGSLIGRPSANPFFFYSAKLSIFVSIGLLLCKAIVPSFGGLKVPEGLVWMGTLLGTAGAAILLFSFFQLSDSLKYGLPKEGTQLKTSGLFRFSRNPLYMGLFLVNIASALFFPAIPNILVTIYCIMAHGILIRGEERFLEKRFGAEWVAYKNKVRRFI